MIFLSEYPVIHIYLSIEVYCANCGIEVEKHFLLESLAACHNSNSELVMYFTVNAAFVNCLDQFTYLTESLRTPMIRSQTFNGNKVNLPRLVMIKLRDKFKIRNMMKKEPLLFHIMLKQGITWFTLASSTEETV